MWDIFNELLSLEYIHRNYVRKARKKVIKLKQRNSVPDYLKEFRNFILAIPDVNEVKYVDNICPSLKPQGDDCSCNVWS